MKIKPSNEDTSLLGEEWPTQDYQLPDQTSVVLDAHSDSRISEWSYFWLTFSPGAIRPAWYRLFEKGKRPSKWQPLKSVEQVLQQTGVDDEDDEDPEEARREREGKVGAAEKLPAGEYRLQVKIGRGDTEYELTGIEFKVKAAPVKATPTTSEAEFSMTRPRCHAAALVSFIKLPKLAVKALSDVCRPIRFNGGPEFKPKDLYPEFLQLHGQRVAEYPWPGVFLVTLLPYLAEKHQIMLMKSAHDKVTKNITEGRKAPQYIFTQEQRQAFLAKLEGRFSEPEMRDYFREYNGTDDPEAGKKMLDGIQTLRQSLSALDENSVILFSIGFPPDQRAFLDAARTGDMEKVRELLAAGVPVDVREEFSTHYQQNGQTALMYAAGGGQLELVRLLLKAGASVTAVDKMMSADDGGGQTALHYAAGQPKAAVAEELLNAGADPNALTTSVWKPGYPPLICALRAGHHKVAQLLIQRGTHLGSEIGGKPAYSPLCAALKGQRGEVPAETIRDLVLLLLEAGADPNSVSTSNRTALFDLVIKSLDVPSPLPEPITNLLVEKLLRAGATPDWLDEFGITPLHTAVRYQQLGAVKLLLEAGAEVNRVAQRETPLKIIEKDMAKLEKSLAESPGSPPTDKKAAERREKYRMELEDKLRRGKQIEKILRQFGGK